MSRMDRYEDIEEKEEIQEEIPLLSRVDKNQIIYDDAYLNSKVVDINSVIDGEDIVPKKQDNTVLYQAESYEEKSYDVNDYLSKAHENKKEDNLKRDIDDTAFREQEDEKIDHTFEKIFKEDSVSRKNNKKLPVIILSITIVILIIVIIIILLVR